MLTRNLEERDYDPLIGQIDCWWGGRPMAHLLPRIFFVHFRETSFAMEERGQVAAFLAGFVSQTFPDQAYIHFVGVHPDHRRHGYGRHLYSTFFQAVRHRGCTGVRCITSPVNRVSIAFHTAMGFVVERATGEHEGVPCTIGYELNGQHRVLFVRSLD